MAPAWPAGDRPADRAHEVATRALERVGSGARAHVHLLLLGGSTPRFTTSEFTLSLLVVVVLGGAGSRWGAVLGGVLYTHLDSRLTDLAQSPTVPALPGWLRVPSSGPLSILGTLSVVVVFSVPGGIAAWWPGCGSGGPAGTRARRRLPTGRRCPGGRPSSCARRPVAASAWAPAPATGSGPRAAGPGLGY